MAGSRFNQSNRPIRSGFKTLQIAQVFLDIVYKLHGLPESIILDRNKIFISRFWQELFHMLGISLHYSSSYHSQSDGQNERVNQCLENYLRCMCSDYPTHWSSWLPTAKLWYNTNFHTSLKVTPFEALYGYKPNHIPLGPFHDSVIPAAASMLQDRLQIVAKVGAVAYKLLPPDKARIHPVFHVSLLKKRVGNTQAVEPTLPAIDSADQCLLEPEKILQRRATMRNSQPVIQYLVKWNHLSESESSWEDKSFIDKQFPNFQA
ncbi:uncharacterized protein [Coffea arabica]|uniref:Retrotransposable element Tf2 n=1 Tax=Coffea arabica TaxID=13443 RepID=A0A6P6VJU5_COFAR|nr:uncharacterized protein LOC113724644 [Coffea arabica]